MSRRSQICAVRDKHLFLVAVAGRYVGCLAVADPIAPHSRAAIDRLQRMGVRVLLVSGDGKATVQHVAQQVGIREVHADVRPDEKLAIVESLKRDGALVAMVGDGINDAPAGRGRFGRWHRDGCGCCRGSRRCGHRRARDLRAVPTTIALARATLRTIRQNLVWAFVYNLVLLPLAAGLFVPIFGIGLPPVAAAAAMALSSVSVVANSLLLRHKPLS